MTSLKEIKMVYDYYFEKYGEILIVKELVFAFTSFIWIGLILGAILRFIFPNIPDIASLGIFLGMPIGGCILVLWLFME